MATILIVSASLARAIEVLHEQGMRGLLWRGLARTAFRRLLVAARPLGADLPTPGGPTAAAPARLAFSLLEEDEIDAYASLRPDAPVAEARRRLAAGQRCLVGWLDGRIVHARWFATDVLESPWLGLAFKLRPGIVYVHDAYTAGDARGKGIGASARGLERSQWGRGARALLATVWHENAPGLA